MRANCLEEITNGEVKGVGIDGDSDDSRVTSAVYICDRGAV